MRLLARLFDNNHRWAAGRLAEDPDFFADLCAIQRPDYLWIGCSDSRVPANEIVGLPPGELFVHRNVANVVHPEDTNCLSVLQFAVDTLRISHIIVCGHYGCGGVQASLGPPVPQPLEGWLTPIRAIVAEHRTELDDLEAGARLHRLCELNVIAQVRTLARLRTITNAWGRGQALALHGWIYELHNGLLRDLEVTMDGPDATVG
ncbi:MAG: carbonic anhydrase [Gemmatimonadota bacterium]|nr:carbonic anhydrase [Gemmatimonadota bacterium]MDH4350884.1 carbonic anhydrase [Gemmatimonadota bacterium]